MRPVVQFKQSPIRSSDAFVGEYSLVDLSWHHEVVLTFGGDQVKAMGMIQDKYERRFLHWNLQATQAVPFQRGGNFESPCQILRCITDVWSPSLRDTQNEAIWVDHMSAREELFWKTFSAQMRPILEVWTLFNSCTQGLCPEVKDSIVEKLIGTLSIDRHCLAPLCWRIAHCYFQIRMIGHFFRNYIWLHSLHAFSGPMHVPHVG